MPAVHEGQADAQDPEELIQKELDLHKEALQLSALANQYNANSLEETRYKGLGTANKVDTVLDKLSEEQLKMLWKRRAEDRERRKPQWLALQAEYKKQAAIGAEMIKEDRKSGIAFFVRPAPNLLRLKFKVFGLYLAFQGTMLVLKVKRFFGKLFS